MRPPLVFAIAVIAYSLMAIATVECGNLLKYLCPIKRNSHRGPKTLGTSWLDDVAKENAGLQRTLSVDEVRKGMKRLDKTYIVSKITDAKTKNMEKRRNRLDAIQASKEIVDLHLNKIRTLEEESKQFSSDSEIDFDIEVHGNTIGKNGDGYIELLETPATKNLLERITLFKMIKEAVAKNSANMINYSTYQELEKKYNKYIKMSDTQIVDSLSDSKKDDKNIKQQIDYLVEAVRGITENKTPRFLRTISGKFVPVESAKLDDIQTPVVQIINNNYNYNNKVNVNINSNHSLNKNIDISHNDQEGESNQVNQQDPEPEVPKARPEPEPEPAVSDSTLGEDDKEVRSLLDQLIQLENESGSGPLMMTLDDINKWQSLYVQLQQAIEKATDEEIKSRATEILFDPERSEKLKQIGDIDTLLINLINFETMRKQHTRPLYFIDCIKWFQNYRSLEKLYQDQAEISAPLFEHVHKIIIDSPRLDFANAIEVIMHSYRHSIEMLEDIAVIDFSSQRNGESCLAWLVLRDEYIKLSRRFGLNKGNSSELAPDDSYMDYVYDCKKCILDVKTAENLLRQMDMKQEIVDLNSILDEFEQPVNTNVQPKAEETHIDEVHEDDKHEDVNQEQEELEPVSERSYSTKEIGAEYEETNTIATDTKPEILADDATYLQRFSKEEIKAMKTKRLLASQALEQRIQTAKGG